MRGAHPGGRLPFGPAGIIPADAGSTSLSQRPRGRRWDHPRRCGEHFGKGPQKRLIAGSSPQMRGALVVGGGDETGVGIIPADAGSTMPRRFCTTAQ